MPRQGSLPSDIAAALRDKTDGATIDELVAWLDDIRRFPVLRPSVRSAIYQHLDREGACLFTRIERGRYALRQDQDALAAATSDG